MGSSYKGSDETVLIGECRGHRNCSGRKGWCESADPKAIK